MAPPAGRTEEWTNGECAGSYGNPGGDPGFPQRPWNTSIRDEWMRVQNEGCGVKPDNTTKTAIIPISKGIH